MNSKFLCLIYTLISSYNLLSFDQDNIKTLTALAPVAASHFAKDPRIFYEFVTENPSFAAFPYSKCVLKGFDANPKLKKQTPTSPRSYLDAMHIQFKCMKPIISSLN